MRAIQVTRTGGPDVLHLADLPTPEPGPGQVTIAVAFVAVGLADVLFRRGDFPVKLPFVPGLEVAGHAREVGEGVRGLRVGQPVVTLTMDGQGGYAEVVATSADLVLPLGEYGDALSLHVAAAGIGNASTAHVAFSLVAKLQPGETVLVHGATGGLGSMLGPVAKQLGAEKVIGVVNSDAKAEYARSLGYDEVVRREEVSSRVRSLASDQGVDVIVDPVGGEVRTASLGLLRPLGRLVVVGNASGAGDVHLSANRLWFESTGVLGFTVGGVRRVFPERVRAASREVLGMMARGTLRVDAEVLPLSRAAEVHRWLEQGGTKGKFVLAVDMLNAGTA